MNYLKYSDKKILSILLLFLFVAPGILMAQGIQWASGLTMKDVLQKAKKENKYIFMDCYATWCGPCKQMEKDVFSNDTVGKYFQNKFIAVKVQMDKTESDSKNVRAWYGIAKEIEAKYNIGSFPTYIFLDPNGQIVQKSTSYQPVDKFLATAGMALTPGKKYNDPFEEYNKYKIAYNAGKRDYEKMPEMFLMAKQAKDNEMYQKLGKEYLKHLDNLSEEQLYTRSNILFITDIVSIRRSTNKYLKLFYPNGRKIDLIMNNLGYSTYVVDSLIQQEIIKAGVNNAQGKPDWNNLKDTIKNLFSEDFANRNILFGKVATYTSPYITEEADINLLKDYYKAFSEYMKAYGYGSSFINYGESLLGPFCGRTGNLLGAVSNIAGILYLNYQQDGIIPSKEEYVKMVDWLKIGIAEFIAKKKMLPDFVISNYYKLLYKYAQEYATGEQQDELIKMAIEWAQIALSSPFIDKSTYEIISEHIDRMKRKEPYRTIHG